jgi:hypothetical protein
MKEIKREEDHMKKDAQLCPLSDDTNTKKNYTTLELNMKEKDTLIALLLAAPESREICMETVDILLRSLLLEENAISATNCAST